MLQRYTSQRCTVLKAIQALGHTDISTLKKHLSGSESNISLATIYRSIDVLESNGFIKALTVNGQVLYEPTVGEKHHHFCCTECGKVIDVPLKDIPDVIVNAPENIGNNIVESCEITFYGHCPECQRKIKNRQ